LLKSTNGLFLSCVNRLKTVVSLAVLALWAACTLRCDIEILAYSAAMSCCDEAADESNPAPTQPEQCVCSFLQSGGFISEKSGIPMPAPQVALIISAAETTSLSAAGPYELIYRAPELTKNWQFSCRAAAPPRAPSFVS